MGYRIGECLLCGVKGRWTITRIGDAIVSWSCDSHLTLVLDDLHDAPGRSFNVRLYRLPSDA